MIKILLLRVSIIVVPACLLLVSACATIENSNSYKDCLRMVNDPNTIVFFAITENKKTEEYCRCVAKIQNGGDCFMKVLK